MAIDTKSILVCLWEIIAFLMQICYKFVLENPVFSSVSLFFILLYIFSPTFFAFIIYTLLILISAYGLNRFFLKGDDTSTDDIVKSYKKNDGDPSNRSTNENISDNVNNNNNNREKYTQKSDIEDKNMVCCTRSHDDKVERSTKVGENVKVDKSAKLEENVKDTKEVKVDSVTDGAESSPCKANEHGISQITVGCDEGLNLYPSRKGSSETSEDSQEDRHEDEQKSVTNPVDSNLERYRRLESMIARRKARKLFSFQVRHTLMSAGHNDPVEHLASILVPRNKHLIFNNSNDHAPPESAPSVLLPMHNPFDIPYETHEERPDLTDRSFQQEFLAENKDMMLCRHGSFRWGALFSLGALGDQEEIVSNDVPLTLRAPRKLKNSVLAVGSHLENKDVGEVIQNESCQEKEAISNGCSAEDHATQEGQIAQRGPDSVDIYHKEDKSDAQKKERVAENIVVGSSSSSSSEESLPVCRPNKDAILRSLNSFRRNVGLSKDDDYQENGYTHDSDQTILNNINSDDGFLYAARVMNDHARSTSLASDMLVEVSEINSPRSIPSLDEEYSENEEVKEVSSHPSQVDTSHESNPMEVPEISDQQDNSEGVSRISHNAEAITSDVLPEKVFKEHFINSSNSLSSSMTGLMDSTETHSLDSNIEDLPHSSEKNNTRNITNKNLRDSGTPMNEYLEKSSTLNNLDNGIPKQIIQPSNLPESSNGSNFNSVNHQDLSESTLQNQQNEKRDYNGISEYQASQNILSDNPTSIQSNHSLRSPENRGNEDSVSELEFPVSSTEDEATGLVSEIETGQVPNISSPKSVLQPKFSSDHVSSVDLSQGTSTEYQQSHHLIVDDDSVLPVKDLNHSASQIASPSQGDSTSQPSHVIGRLQDSYPHQSNSNQEAETSNHIDNKVEQSSLESVENTKGDNHHKESSIMEPSNSPGSNSFEDTESSPNVKLKEFQEAKLDDVANQPQEADVEDSSVVSKAPDTVFDQKQTELNNSTGNLVAHVDINEPVDLASKRTIEEANNSTAYQNDPVITDSEGS